MAKKSKKEKGEVDHIFGRHDASCHIAIFVQRRVMICSKPVG